MSSVSTFIVSTSATRSPTRVLSGTKNDAHYIVGDFQGINVGASLPVGPGRARKLHGHPLCISATGQGSPTPGNVIKNQSSSGSKVRRLEYDVVIVGAGIIGLATAHHILLNTNLSVALIDAAEPCAGATGAGQYFSDLIHQISNN
jgi:hypothetical protein